MPEFFNVLPPQQALATLLQVLPPPSIAFEDVPAQDALGRITATDLVSRQDLPTFARSTVDGYSLRAADSFGATEGLPACFSVVGEVPMGRAPAVAVSLGEAALTYTGGMLAIGADAVVMVEHTQQIDADTIEVVRPVAPGQNVVQPGEDVRTGDIILPRGHLLRPQDVGGLAALGIASVSVARRPRVAVLSMGDEVVSPQSEPAVGQVRDINSYTIASQILRGGAEPVPLGIVPDNYQQQLEVARRGLEHSDALIFSAGSSVSARDMTADIINALGQPGVLVHGLSIHPGKPAIVGMVDEKPVFGLPGNPVSAMIVFDLLVRPILYHLAGSATVPEPATAAARLDRDVASAPGRQDYVPVRLKRKHDNGSEDLVAEPVFGKSNLIFTLIRADGLVQVPLDQAGLYAGQTVEVRLFQ